MKFEEGDDVRNILFISSLLFIHILVGCSSQTGTTQVESKDYYKMDEDIQDIGELLKDEDIVIIGESTHWSADIAEEKIKLIDYLSVKHGFSKLFLETSDSEFNYYKDIEADPFAGIAEQYQQEVFREFLDGSHKNIEVLPMDWTPHFEQNNASYVSELEDNITQEISEHDSLLADEFKKSEYALRDWFAKGLLLGQNVGTLERPTDVYEGIKQEEFFNKLSESSQKYIESRHDNIKKYYSKINFDNALIDYYDYREIGMSDKILSQMDEGDKAIVWVANGHSNYDVTKIDHTHEVFQEQRRNERQESLGALLRESEYDIYNVGLFYNEADKYDLLQDDYSTPRKTGDDTLEGYIGDRVSSDIFIDFSSSDFLEEKIYTSYTIGEYDYEITPQEQFDGMIYLDHLSK